MNKRMSFTELNEEEEKELYKLYRLYWREALKCEQAKVYLAGCIMAGSALEATLILMINCYADEAEQTGRIPKLRNGKPKPLLSWTLAELLRVAKAAKWLPSALDLNDEWDGRKAKIGDYAEVIRMVRNLVHPSKYLKEHFRKSVASKYLQRQLEVVLLCRDWLAYHNNKSLQEHLKADGN